MYGRKMEQTKQAFKSMLNELRSNDYFNVIQFNSEVSTWKKEKTYPATKKNILQGGFLDCGIWGGIGFLGRNGVFESFLGQKR